MTAQSSEVIAALAEIAERQQIVLDLLLALRTKLAAAGRPEVIDASEVIVALLEANDFVLSFEFDTSAAEAREVMRRAAEGGCS